MNGKGSVNGLIKNLLLATATAMLLYACSLAPVVYGPGSYKINGEAEPTINVNGNGKSLSLVVHLYQLQDRSQFDRLTFDTATSGKTDQDLFANTLVNVKELVMVPNDKQQFTEKLDERTRFIGVVGYFRQPDAQAWRFLIDAKTARSKGLSFRVRDCYLEVTSPEPLPIPGQELSARPECGKHEHAATSEE